jgi:hypothetical protein
MSVYGMQRGAGLSRFEGTAPLCFIEVVFFGEEGYNRNIQSYDLSFSILFLQQICCRYPIYIIK